MLFDIPRKYVRSLNAILIGYENRFEHNESFKIFTQPTANPEQIKKCK